VAVVELWMTIFELTKWL